MNLSTINFLGSVKLAVQYMLYVLRISVYNIIGYFLQPSWRAKPASWGCPKIVLDHVRVLYIYIYIYIYVCALWVSSLLVVYDAIDNTSSSRATRTEN